MAPGGDGGAARRLRRAPEGGTVVGPKGPSTQQLGTWVLGNKNYIIIIAQVLCKYMIIRYLDP